MSKKRHLVLVPPERPAEPMLTVPKRVFTLYHSCARTVLANMMKVSYPNLLVQESMRQLDQAIDDGHQILGTDRGAADQYIQVAGGIMAAQANHIQGFLNREGLGVEDVVERETEPS